MRVLGFISLVLFLSFPVATVFAHAFGEQFVLPLPVSFYTVGGMGAFIASCLVLLAFSKPISAPRAFEVSIPFPGYSAVKTALAVFGLALAFLSVVIGLLGPQEFRINPVPNLFWVVFLLFFAYVTAFIGGLWERIDPLRTITRFLAPHTTKRVLPQWLPYVPAVMFFALLWLELLSPGWGAVPWIISAVFIGYLAVSILISRKYGSDAWFSQGEFFSVFFNTIGKLAPLAVEEKRIRFSFPGERLVHEKPVHMGVLFVIFIMLGSTVVDGLRESQIWWDAIFALNLNGVLTYRITEGFFLLVMPGVLLGSYMCALSVMRAITGSNAPVGRLMLEFAYSLVPIAVAYNFAHYVSLVLVNGQNFIAQVSDPFGAGWNLFGTAGYQMNPGLIGADVAWYLQLAVIIGGHVLAAIVAHRVSLRLFTKSREVMLSQLPMLVLMVLFTAFGLWTLTQPFAQ